MGKTARIQTIEGKDFRFDIYIDPYNKRLRVNDYRGNVTQITVKAEELAVELLAEKLIIIARIEHFPALCEQAFQCEAMVDYFFCGSHACYFTKYFNAERRKNDHWILEDRIIKNASLLARNEVRMPVPPGYELKKILTEDAEKLSTLYRDVFQIYPTPLHDPAYIQKTIEQGTIYYAYIFEGNIVSAASAEVNNLYHNAELTDCATLPKHRKFGLMKYLLEKLEGELKKQGIYCAFSIARAQSFGMNAVLHQLGYAYRGRLMNNCYIFEKLENMNMWVKDLSRN